MLRRHGRREVRRPDLDDGIWHFIALTRDAASGAVKVYVDGVISGSTASGAGQKSTPFNPIGRIADNGGTIDYFAGSLDDVRVYDRLLSAAEVASLMPGGIITAQPSPTPTAVRFEISRRPSTFLFSARTLPARRT